MLSPRPKVHFFMKDKGAKVIAIEYNGKLPDEYISKLESLTGGEYTNADRLEIGGHVFVGPKTESISPFSTNAVEGAKNIGLSGITRIEEFNAIKTDADIDRMTQRKYAYLGPEIFFVGKQPDPIRYIDDLETYNKEEGLALSADEINYLNGIAKKYGRPLTDSEIFGFSQANSEHCRHKIFNGEFIIDGEVQTKTLFQMIKETKNKSPEGIVSAYTDNVAFTEGPQIMQWAPDENGIYKITPIDGAESGKTETHNFPTTVEPFNGAATGAGGEIRDGFGGGRGSKTSAGSAVYMVSYPRVGDILNAWEKKEARKWLYQSPQEILTKASNGVSDFGNKFGRPVIGGATVVLEHEENEIKYGYDKTIMQSGGVGYANIKHALKDDSKIKKGQRIILLGGDNYRIGVGGGSVSSLNTGDAASSVELNAVQRANAEMQKRVYNVIRALIESENNPIISIHDHGAGGHFNCLLEIVGSQGGKIDMSKLPVGDKTLSAREIIGNESQERMAILIDEKDWGLIMEIAAREQCPIYDIGEITGDGRFVFEQEDGQRPIDMEIKDLIGNPPKTTIRDNTIKQEFKPLEYAHDLERHLKNVLSFPTVGSKDFLTNKVDRSVTGLVDQQQCVGELQLPLSDCGVVRFDYETDAGMSIATGSAPAIAMVDAAAGSRVATARAFTNSIFVPQKGIVLSDNWMGNPKHPGEGARLFEAVKAASEFVQELGICIPTGKDSMSMKQVYPNGDEVLAPLTLIVTAKGSVHDLDKAVGPVMVQDKDTSFYHIDMSGMKAVLGGSAFAQTVGQIGNEVPDVKDTKLFKNVFNAVQEMLDKGIILAGHDISAGGLATTLIEMAISNKDAGLRVNNYPLRNNIYTDLFSENPGVVIQIKNENMEEFNRILESHNVPETAAVCVAYPIDGKRFETLNDDCSMKSFSMDDLRDTWMKPSIEMEKFQNNNADILAKNYANQPIVVDGKDLKNIIEIESVNIIRNSPKQTVAAVLRDKGTNGDRELAYAAHLGGFDMVKDITVTDLITGHEDLKDVGLLLFAGGFSNSDVLGAGKIWAKTLEYNSRASDAISGFYARDDNLSLGICNGCQVMMERGLINGIIAPMQHNDSGKFESRFLSTYIPENNSVMLANLSGMTFPIWVAHGEGKFDLPAAGYQTVLKYHYNNYPGNPNGSKGGVAGIASPDGRHIAMMPHPERAVMPYQWAHGHAICDMEGREVTPWVHMFVNAHNWLAR